MNINRTTPERLLAEPGNTPQRWAEGTLRYMSDSMKSVWRDAQANAKRSRDPLGKAVDFTTGGAMALTREVALAPVTAIAKISFWTAGKVGRLLGDAAKVAGGAVLTNVKIIAFPDVPNAGKRTVRDIATSAIKDRNVSSLGATTTNVPGASDTGSGTRA
jgi:hypothetical protein